MLKFCEAIKENGIEVSSILEIGSRDGHDAAYIAQYFDVPETNVWLCEPNPTQSQYIRGRYPNFNLVEKAIFDTSGTMEFRQMHGSMDEIGTSSLLPRRLDGLYNKATIIEVDVITGSELLSMIPNDISVCKIDVEGATFQVLQSMGQSINKIDAFHLECEHIEVWDKQIQYDDISKFMLENGYVQLYFEYVVGQIQSDSAWVKKKTD